MRIKQPRTIPITRVDSVHFFGKVKKSSGCWKWLAHKTKDGYGQFAIDRKAYFAHRVAYTLLKGKIPNGLHIDHLCRHPWCVNPSHMEAVSLVTNTMRGNLGKVQRERHAKRTTCPKGHAKIGDNLVVYQKGGYQCRGCRTCKREELRRWRKRR